MRWPTLTTLVLGALSLWGCSGGDGTLPAEYREIDVPEQRLRSSEARQRGRDLFLEHCALCHGQRADGRGVRRNLSSQPADFTDPVWRQQTSLRRVYHAIREGVPGTAMASWKVLSEEETWDLVAYVLSVAERSSPEQSS